MQLRKKIGVPYAIGTLVVIAAAWAVGDANPDLSLRLLATVITISGAIAVIRR
jgi:hypothetical protein